MSSTVVADVYLILFLFTFICGASLAVYIKLSYEDLSGNGEISKAIFFTGVWGLNSFLRVSYASSRLISEVLLATGLLAVLLTAYYWYRFGVVYTNKSLLGLNEGHKFSLSVIAIIFLFAVTNPVHSLVWASFTYNAELNSFTVSKTVLYLSFVTLAYLWYLTGIYYVSSFTYKVKNFFSTSLMIASIIPILVGNAIPYIFPVSIQNSLTFIPVGGFISLGMGFIAVQRLTVTPIAREKIFEEISLPIFVRNSEGRVVDYNSEFEELCSQQFNKSIQLVSDELLSQLKKVEFGEIEMVNYNNEFYNLTITPLEINGKPQGDAVILHNITEIQKQRSELERTNYHFQKFSDSAAHEIRNPLTVIKGYSEQIATKTKAEDIKEKAEKIQEQADHISEVTRDFQEAMKIAQTIDGKEYLDIETTVTNIYEMNGYESFNSIIVSPTGRILADEKRFSQIFEKIFEFLEANSKDVKYTVTVSAYENGFTITTTGQHFDESLINGVLEHGYTNRHNGTGLSLSIIDILAEVHGWNVSVKTKEGNLLFEFSGAKVKIGDEKPD